MDTEIQRQLRNRWVEIIDLLLDCGKPEAALECARQATALGLWRDPRQRPTQYLPQLTATPVHDPKRFWFTSYLEKNHPAIKQEVMAYFERGGDEFRPYDVRLIDMGKWEQLLLYQEGQMVERACEMFPTTTSVISTISEATPLGVTSISVVHPGTHFIPHCGPTNARLRVHLCIKSAEGVHMEISGHSLHWEEGRCIVFDDSYEHEVWHRGREPRIVLIFDVWHPDLTPEDVRALARLTSREDVIRSFMEQRGLRRIDCDEQRKSARFYPDDQTNKAILRHIWENDISEVELRAGKLYFKNAN